MEAKLTATPPLLAAERERIGIMETRLRWRLLPGTFGMEAARRSEQAAVRVLGATWTLGMGALICRWSVADRRQRNGDAVA